MLLYLLELSFPTTADLCILTFQVCGINEDQPKKNKISLFSDCDSKAATHCCLVLASRGRHGGRRLYSGIKENFSSVSNGDCCGEGVNHRKDAMWLVGECVWYSLFNS